jgi:hypothetical protein
MEMKMRNFTTAMCVLFILVCAGEVRAGRCSGITSPVFCDDFDRWCDPVPPNPDDACECGTDLPDQAAFELFWPDQGCPQPQWPDPAYESSPHWLVASGSWKCDPPEHTQGYGALVHHSSGSRIVLVRRHDHDMTDQILTPPPDNPGSLAALNGAGPIDAPYSGLAANPSYVDSMDRALRPDALKGQFFLNTGTCGHYAYFNTYIEFYLNDDRAPTNFIRQHCQGLGKDAKGDVIDCNCGGGSCAGVCVGNVCTNGAGSCTADIDCATCDNGPLQGMSCTEDAQCRHGPFWQTLLTGDGQRHNSIAIGLMAVMDSGSCRTNDPRPQIWRLVVFDGLTWNQFKAPAFELPLTPGGSGFPEGDFWDLYPWNGYNIVEFAIGAEYMEVRLYNERATAYHNNGNPGKCTRLCVGDWVCLGGPWHDYGCDVGSGPDDTLCEGVGPYSAMPPLPYPYFVARVQRQDDTSDDAVNNPGPFNKIAIGPSPGLDANGTPTCFDFGTLEKPYRRCLGGENDGLECTTDLDCTVAVTERCMEVGLGQSPMVEELVLFDGVFQNPPGIQGACCLPNTACVVTTEDDCTNTLNGQYQGNLVPCTDYLCCYDPFADADNDGDADQDDFALFQKCYTGDGAGPPTPECKCFDQVGTGLGTPPDDDVDSDDFQAFEICASGPNVPHDPACDD